LNERAHGTAGKDTVMQRENAEEGHIDEHGSRFECPLSDFAKRNHVREEEVGESGDKEHRTAPHKSAGGGVAGIHGPLL
jgi:hypothetical protein